jgi:xanthine/CO dehydrogenase XdhC/CoxF family maturation factor
MTPIPRGRRLVVVGRGVTAERVAALCGPLYEELCMSQEVVEFHADDHVVIAEDEPDAGRALLYMAAQGEVLPAYLGYAAPHREGWKALVSLAAREVQKSRIDAVSAPAGVDVGAESPDEVAISVAAELVAIRRGRPRPSAGLEVTPARGKRPRPTAEARPRRLIGSFARPLSPGDDADDDGDDTSGRN